LRLATVWLRKLCNTSLTVARSFYFAHSHTLAHSHTHTHIHTHAHTQHTYIHTHKPHAHRRLYKDARTNQFTRTDPKLVSTFTHRPSGSGSGTPVLDVALSQAPSGNEPYSSNSSSNNSAAMAAAAATTASTLATSSGSPPLQLHSSGSGSTAAQGGFVSGCVGAKEGGGTCVYV